MADLRLATRGSPLALAQTGAVIAALEAAHPGIAVEPLVVTTSGDVDRETPVTMLAEQGAFVRRVQEAVLDGRADAAVHSCKDLPVEGPDGLVAIHPRRGAPWDVLCGATLGELPAGGRVGTGSPRRAAQLRAHRPDLDIVAIRGNVGTRLAKVDSGELDAVVLAEAGLVRLGLSRRITQRLGLGEMVPAPAQGALAVEHLADGEAADLLAVLDDEATRRAVGVERAVLALTHLGCRGALGAYAEPTPGGTTRVTGFVDAGRGPVVAGVTAIDADAAVALCTALDLPLDGLAAGGIP